MERRPSGEQLAVPLSISDPDRLAAVTASGLIDAPPDAAFDRLASLAARLLDAPLAFATAVDEERSWYKSFIGAPSGAQRWGAVEASFCQYVIGADSECIIGDARTDPLTAANPAIEEMGVVAWAGFPIRAPDGHILGTLCVVDTVAREWTDRDREVLDTLAGAASAEVALRAALQEEASQRQRAEAALAALEGTAARAQMLAATLSASLLPPRLQPVEGLDIAAAYLTAQTNTVTGDFYDLFRIAPEQWAVVIGDVVGKGPAAATFASELRYSVRAAAAHSTSPSEVLNDVNQTLLDHSTDRTGEQFATAAYVTIERSPDGWYFDVALAGHLQPLLLRADGTIEEIGSAGLPLGLFPDMRVADVRVEVRSGDALLLYTDGVTEARNGPEQMGLRRVEQLLQDRAGAQATTLVDTVMKEVEAFTRGKATDDTAVIALRVV